MTDKLLNCPFCGGEAELIKGWCELDNYVMCLSCRTRTKPMNTKESAIKVWNTRKPMDKIVEQLEKWKQEADEQYEDTDSELYKMASVGKYHAYKQAIEIVKEGGKDE